MSSEAAVSPSPPMKASDIRHVSKDENSTASQDLHKVKNRSRFKRSSIKPKAKIGSNSFRNTELDVMPRRVCSGTILECLSATEMEMEMDSETNRRVLVMQKRYISYETLKKDMIPCGRPGASYYNCPTVGQANPYSRGCEVITRCARDIQKP